MFLSLQPMFPPKPFDYLEGLNAFGFFFKLLGGHMIRRYFLGGNAIWRYFLGCDAIWR